jgi:hypothetical protein
MRWLALIIVAFASVAWGQSGESITGPAIKTPPYSITVNPACPPQFNAVPNPYTFTSTAIGSNASQVITIYNTGCSVMAISGLVTSSNAQFTGPGLSTDHCSNANVAAGLSCTITAIFTPTATGIQSANFSVPDDTSTGPDSIILSGTGTTVYYPHYQQRAPVPTTFGNVTVGSSATQTITIGNTGTANLILGALGTPSLPQFTVASITDLCSGQSIAPAGNCTFVAKFSPTAAGLLTATVSVPSNASTSPDTVTMSGTGVVLPTPTITTPSCGTPPCPITNATSGVAYSYTFGATGGTPPYTWSFTSGTLPTGLSLTGSTGVVSGTTTVVGTTSLTVEVTDSLSQTSSLAITLTVVSGFTATYYVSPAAGTASCSAGSDSNDGKAAMTGGGHGPWLTPGHAQTVLRGVSKTSPISVAICGGTANANSINPIPDYYNVSLSMTNLDSGASGNVVTWENYPGESPALSGGTQITTLALSTTDICANIASCYQTSIANTVPYFERLYYNGGDRLRPHLGATATNLVGQYGHSTASVAGSGNSAFTFSPLGIVNTITNAVPVAYPSCNLSSPNDCEINAFTKWVAYIERISSFTGPIYATNLDDTTSGWTICVLPACNPGGGGTPTGTLTINHATPSLDGESMETTCAGPANSNCLFYHNYGASDNTTAFTATWHSYFDANGQTANAWEYDVEQYLNAPGGGVTNNTRLTFGTQCDMVHGLIQIWDNVTGWQNTSPTIACPLPNLQWNTIIWNFHRVTGDVSCGAGYPKMYYDTLTLNGTVYQVNNTTCSAALPGGYPDDVLIQHQGDIGSSGATLTEYLDLYSLAGSGMQINTTCGSSCPSASAGPGSPYANGYRYTLDNVKELFQYPGQWFLDRSSTNPNNPNWTLSYIANAGENPTTDTIVVGNNAEVISAEALSYWTFTGLNFMHDNWTVPSTGYLAQQQQSQLTNALVACDNCTNVTFSGNTFGQTTTTGLQFTAASSNFSATGNIAYDTGGAGYRIGYPPSATSHTATDTQVPNNGTISQNWSTGFDRFLVDSYGIQIGLANTLTVSNNDVHYGYNTGIGTCIPGYPGPNQCASPASGNHGDFNLTYTGNDVGNIGEGVTTDLGAYYIMTSRATGSYSLSTSTAPVNVGTNSWKYTFATTQSAAGSNAWLGWGIINAGYTGSALGNNGTLLVVTASTTTTVTVTNTTGTTVNTGTPLLTTLGSATGNSFTGNRGHDVNSSVVNGDTADTMGHCLYLDGSTGLWSVQNNLLYRCTGMGINMNFGPAASGIGNLFSNNVVLNSGPQPSGTASIRVQSPLNTVNEFSATSNIFSMALSTNTTTNAQTGPPATSTSTIQTYASNIWNFTGTPKFNVVSHPGITFSAWQGYGEDTAGTISTSPGFTAPGYCPSNSTVPTGYCDNFSFTNGVGPGFGFNGSVFTNTYGPTVKITPPTVADTFPIATLPPSSFGGTLVACGPPTYNCSRTDLATVQTPTCPPQMGPNTCASPLTSTGNTTGAGAIQYDPNFYNPVVRVTDNNTKTTVDTWVPTPSGDDKNLWATDSSLFWAATTNSGNSFPFSFNTSTMAAARLYVSANWNLPGEVTMSRVTNNVVYNISGTQYLKYVETPPYTTIPSSTLVYDFASSTKCLGGFTDVTGYTISNAGTAYVDGDILTAGAGGAQFRVLTVGGSGNILTMHSNIGGTGYTTSTVYSLTGGTGTGAQITVTSVGFLVTWTGNLSAPSTGDGVFAAMFSDQGAQNTGYYVVAYISGVGCTMWNTSTGAVTSDAGAGSNGTISIPDRFLVHSGQLAINGTYLNTGWETCLNPPNCTAAGGAPYIWQIGTLTAIPITAGENASGHGAKGYNKLTNGFNLASFAIRSYATPATNTQITTLPSGMATPWDLHGSWENDNSTDTNPFFWVSFSITTPFPSALYNEVDAADPTGTGKFWRFAQVENTAQSPIFQVGNPTFVVSQDGKWGMFASDWMGTLGSITGASTCTLGSAINGCQGQLFIVKLQ